MGPLRKVGFAATILLTAHLLFPSPAHAYLDPGSGSFMFQMLVAALLGASVTIKMQWKKLKGLFSPSARRESGSKVDE